jgi:hypothetical protein
MGSNAKKKTTMAKLNRETRLRERRMEKQVRKAARKQAAASAAHEDRPSDTPAGDDAERAPRGPLS